MIIRSIIIDDEPLARKGLREYIRDVEFLELAGEFDHPVKASEIISRGEVDLLFLDIEMPKLDGLSFFKTLQHPPPVIFTTAYPQYALDGFDVNALDYLVKPISFARFLAAALKAKEFFLVRQKNLASPQEDFFFIKAENRLTKIVIEDILFVEALQNYVTIHTRDKKYLTYLTFKSVQDYLPADRFIKTHKSFIVSASKIDSIEGNELRIGTHHIPISRNEKEAVMEKLTKGRFLKR
jgi:DNA-binding LytR/AlgR family response regulator